jgi:hypothetical protein
VLGVDGALANLAGEHEVFVWRFVGKTGLTLARRLGVERSTIFIFYIQRRISLEREGSMFIVLLLWVGWVNLQI